MDSMVLNLTSRDLKPLPKFTDLPEKYLCVNCHNPLQGPSQTACGHRICNPCLGEILAADPPPMCPAREDGCVEVTTETVFPDFCAKKEIQQLPVACKYEQFGCTESIKWKDLDAHVASCRFARESCPNEGCTVSLPASELQEHVNQNCAYTPEQCRHCKQMVARGFREEHMQDHCPEMRVPCPFKCGEQAVLRKELDSHQQHCRSKPLECKYKAMGCTFQGSEPEIQKHNRDAVENHLDIVTGRCADMEVSVAELSNKLQEKTNQSDMLTTQCRHNSEESARLNRLVEEQKKKINTLEKTVASKLATVIQLQDEVRSLEKRCEQSEMEQRQKMKQLQETQTHHDRRLTDVERNGPVAAQPGQDVFRHQVEQQDRQLGLYDLRLAQMDLRFQCLETANYEGILIWKICDYKRRHREAGLGKTLSLYSQPFYTSRYGYKMCARVYLNGDGLGKGTHMSLFFVVMKGDYDELLPWPFKQKVTLTLQDQIGKKRHLSDTFRPDPTSSSFQKPQNEMNVASGCPLFVAQSVLESEPYLKNDTIFIKLVVEKADLPLH